MRRKLLVAGLILFPLISLYCFMAVVVVQATNEGSTRPFEVALYYARIYGACGLLSAVAFVACLVAFINSGRRVGGFR